MGSIVLLPFLFAQMHNGMQLSVKSVTVWRTLIILVLYI